MAAHEVVLCIQDTTELNFNGQEASGLAPLSYEAQRGMHFHPHLRRFHLARAAGRARCADVGAQGVYGD